MPTRMGGAGAPDDMDRAHLTQARLAAGDDVRVTYHLQRLAANSQAHDPQLQMRLLQICEEVSGIALP